MSFGRRQRAPAPQPVTPLPDPGDGALARIRARMQERLRQRRGAASTRLSGPLGDGGPVQQITNRLLGMNNSGS